MSMQMVRGADEFSKGSNFLENKEETVTYFVVSLRFTKTLAGKEMTSKRIKGGSAFTRW